MEGPREHQEFESEKQEQELFELRLREQESKKDYSFLENGERETCDDCGGNINSHGHCTRCDY